MNGEDILLLDPYARPGRTGHRFNVRQAKHLRGRIRWLVGTSKEDTPTVTELLDAAKALSALLYDATEGDAQLTVRLDGDNYSPSAVLSTLVDRITHP